MPKKTIAPAPAMPTTATAVFTDETLREAADLATNSRYAYRPLWTGPSGEESSGESVARHLPESVFHQPGRRVSRQPSPA